MSIYGLTNAKPDGSKRLLGRGQVYIDRLDPTTGARGGQLFSGDVKQFLLSGAEETIKEYSSVTPDSPLVASASLQREVTLELTMTEVEQKKLAIALFGTAATLTQTSGSFGSGAGDALGAAAFVCKGGYWYPLASGKRNISAVTIKHTTISGTTVSASDYEVDGVNGMIFVKAGGGGDNKVLFVECTYGADTRLDVSVFDANVTAYVRFQGDPAQGPACGAEFWKVVFSPEGGLDLIGTEFAKFPLKGSVLNDAPNHPTQPYGHIWHA